MDIGDSHSKAIGRQVVHVDQVPNNNINNDPRSARMVHQQMLGMDSSNYRDYGHLGQHQSEVPGQGQGGQAPRQIKSLYMVHSDPSPPVHHHQQQQQQQQQSMMGGQSHSQHIASHHPVYCGHSRVPELHQQSSGSYHPPVYMPPPPPSNDFHHSEMTNQVTSRHEQRSIPRSSQQLVNGPRMVSMSGPAMSEVIYVVPDDDPNPSLGPSYKRLKHTDH
jgi:hypothetical protein